MLARHAQMMLACALLFVAAACARGHDAAQPSGGSAVLDTSTQAQAYATIRGHLYVVGGPALYGHAPPPRPVPGTITITNRASRVQQRVTLARGSAYVVALPPGSYGIEGRSPDYGDGEAPCLGGSGSVTLRAGDDLTFDVECQIP